MYISSGESEDDQEIMMIEKAPNKSFLEADEQKNSDLWKNESKVVTVGKKWTK